MIPGVSDIYSHLYLHPSIFVVADGKQNILPLKLGFAIYRDLVQIDPAPFRHIDGSAETNLLPEGHVGPIPGNYYLLAGSIPFAEATNAQVKVLAQQKVTRLNPLPSFVSDALLQYGTGRGDLSHTVHMLCQIV